MTHSSVRKSVLGRTVTQEIEMARLRRSPVRSQAICTCQIQGSLTDRRAPAVCDCRKKPPPVKPPPAREQHTFTYATHYCTAAGAMLTAAQTRWITLTVSSWHASAAEIVE